MDVLKVWIEVYAIICAEKFSIHYLLESVVFSCSDRDERILLL